MGVETEKRKKMTKNILYVVQLKADFVCCLPKSAQSVYIHDIKKAYAIEFGSHKNKENIKYIGERWRKNEKNQKQSAHTREIFKRCEFGWANQMQKKHAEFELK